MFVKKCKCNTETCSSIKKEGFDWCHNSFGCKCNVVYCNNSKDNIIDDYCKKCLCIKCDGSKFPDEKICDECNAKKIIEKKCEFDSCNKKLCSIDTYCKMHTCYHCMINKIDIHAELYVPKYSPPRYLFTNCAIWKPNCHNAYPKYFNVNVINLLLVLHLEQ